MAKVKKGEAKGYIFNKRYLQEIEKKAAKWKDPEFCAQAEKRIEDHFDLRWGNTDHDILSKETLKEVQSNCGDDALIKIAARPIYLVIEALSNSAEEFCSASDYAYLRPLRLMLERCASDLIRIAEWLNVCREKRTVHCMAKNK